MNRFDKVEMVRMATVPFANKKFGKVVIGKGHVGVYLESLVNNELLVQFDGIKALVRVGLTQVKKA